jgi:hypothetical protein
MSDIYIGELSLTSMSQVKDGFKLKPWIEIVPQPHLSATHEFNEVLLYKGCTTLVFLLIRPRQDEPRHRQLCVSS